LNSLCQSSKVYILDKSSIKLLGKSLPFADLPSTLKKVKNKKEKEEE